MSNSHQLSQTLENDWTKKVKLLCDPTATSALINILSAIIEDPKNIQRQDLDYKSVQNTLKDCKAAFDILLHIGFKEHNENAEKRLRITVNEGNLSYIKQVYIQLKYKLRARSRAFRHEFDCKELMKSKPPQFRDGAKQLIFKTICPNAYNDCFGTMVYSRYSVTELPLLIPNPTDFIQNKLKIQSNIYEYTCNTVDLSTAHFYVNFADHNLFGFYRGSLFAQDEIMTTEHPILGSLRETLIESYHSSKDKTKLIPKCDGAVVILNALKHGHFYQKNLAKIYGNKFRMSDNEEILKCLQVCKPPIVDNIICIAAIMGRKKAYKKEEIQTLLQTAYCGFNGAKCEIMHEAIHINVSKSDNDEKEDKKLKKENGNENGEKRIVLHSGNWGCGAFGGNKELMAILQVIAAVAAGVDMMYYHTVNDTSKAMVMNGCKVLNEIYSNCRDEYGQMKRDLLIDALMKREYKWGTPNGT